MGCSGTKDNKEHHLDGQPGEQSPAPGPKLKIKSPPDPRTPEVHSNPTASPMAQEESTNFDGVVISTLSAILRLCNQSQMEVANLHALHGQAAKLLEVVEKADCPASWRAYLGSAEVRTATADIVSGASLCLLPDGSTSEFKKAVAKHTHHWITAGPNGLDRPIRPVAALLGLSDPDETEIKAHVNQRSVYDAWIELGLLTVCRHAHETAKQIANSMECAARGQLSLSTLEAVVRGEAVVCSELEAMWGEASLLKQTMVATAAQADPTDVALAGTASRALSVLLMSKSQGKVVQQLVAVVVRAQNGQEHKLSAELRQQLGYLLVEMHCRGYANGAAIIQRASVLLGQIPAGPPDSANSLKLQSVLFRLESLASFLSIDVAGAEDLPVRLDALRRQGGKSNNADGDRAATASAVRAVAADKGRIIATRPVQRAETVLGTPWELGNNREYGHMSLLFKMLEEADKLDIAENHPGSDKMTENTQTSLSTIALQQVLPKIEALQWGDKNQLYQKVQGTLALIDVFNCAQGVVAGQTPPCELQELYSSKTAEIDYVTTCDSSMQAEFNQAQILPIEQVLNTISRVQRGKSSLERLEIELVKGWSALYSLIVDGLALASANRIVQYVQSAVRGSISVNNLMVLLRSERALLNELQADLSHLVTFSQLNVKIEEACASHSGAHILQEASASISTALESAEAKAEEASWSVETLQDLNSAGQYFITHKRIDKDTPQVVLKGAQLLMSCRMAGYRVNELAQALVALELKSVRAVDISGLAHLKLMMKIQSDEPHKIREFSLVCLTSV